jgi:hypothetical protein
MARKKAEFGPEEPIPLSAVSGIIMELYGRKVSRQAVYQWAKEGRQYNRNIPNVLQVEFADHNIVKLRTGIRFGQKYTKLPWIRAFVDAIT